MLLKCGIFNPIFFTLLPLPQPVYTLSVSECNSFSSLHCPYFYLILTPNSDSDLIDFFLRMQTLAMFLR